MWKRIAQGVFKQVADDMVYIMTYIESTIAEDGELLNRWEVVAKKDGVVTGKVMVDVAEQDRLFVVDRVIADMF